MSERLHHVSQVGMSTACGITLTADRNGLVQQSIAPDLASVTCARCRRTAAYRAAVRARDDADPKWRPRTEAGTCEWVAWPASTVSNSHAANEVERTHWLLPRCISLDPAECYCTRSDPMAQAYHDMMGARWSDDGEPVGQLEEDGPDESRTWAQLLTDRYAEMLHDEDTRAKQAEWRKRLAARMRAS